MNPYLFSRPTPKDIYEFTPKLTNEFDLLFIQSLASEYLIRSIETLLAYAIIQFRFSIDLVTASYSASSPSTLESKFAITDKQYIWMGNF